MFVCFKALLQMVCDESHHILALSDRGTPTSLSRSEPSAPPQCLPMGARTCWRQCTFPGSTSTPGSQKGREGTGLQGKEKQWAWTSQKWSKGTRGRSAIGGDAVPGQPLSHLHPVGSAPCQHLPDPVQAGEAGGRGATAHDGDGCWGRVLDHRVSVPLLD